MEVILIDTEAFYKLINEVVVIVKNNLKVEKEWITEKELMTILNVKSKSTIQKLRNQGMIEYSQPAHKIILYKFKSVMEYLEKHTNKTF